MEAQALKALQQRIVKFPRDAQALAHCASSPKANWRCMLVKTQLVKGPKQSEKQRRTRIGTTSSGSTPKNRKLQ